MAQLLKNLPAMRETWVRSLGWEDPLGKAKAPHSSALAWRTPRTGATELDTTERLSFFTSVPSLSYPEITTKYTEITCTHSEKSITNNEIHFPTSLHLSPPQFPLGLLEATGPKAK